jgi:release factor glutamine methyltransferase
LLEWTTPFFTRKGVDSPRLCAELLLAHVLGVQRIKLYPDFERALGDGELSRYRELVRRAGEHEPVAYLTGQAHFFNLEFEVNRDVLIPRPDTEVMVEQVIRLIRAEEAWTQPRVLDLCTGSGCVAAAIAANLKNARVWAVEKSAAAAAMARKNFQKLGLDDRVFCAEGDLYDALESLADHQPYQVIVANPPYIASGQIAGLDRNVRDFEPVAALDGGPDGLEITRRIWAGAAPRLTDGGRVLVEIAFDQGPAALSALADVAALTEGRIIKDYAGRDRVVVATRR